MEQAREETLFENLQQDFRKYLMYTKYKMTIRGMKTGLVVKGVMILGKLYSEKDMKERELLKKELKILLMALDGMNYFHSEV